jgi:hypothetical protein
MSEGTVSNVGRVVLEGVLLQVIEGDAKGTGHKVQNPVPNREGTV